MSGHCMGAQEPPQAGCPHIFAAQVLGDSAEQAHPAFTELAEAVNGERTSDLEEVMDGALALQSPSGSPRKDGFSRTGGKVWLIRHCLR